MGGSSLARSEGNLSGIALLFDEVANKWLELLVETVPVAQRICVLFDPSPSDALQLRAIGATAEKLGKTSLPLRIDNVDMIPNALERARSEKLDGLRIPLIADLHRQCSTGRRVVQPIAPTGDLRGARAGRARRADVLRA